MTIIPRDTEAEKTKRTPKPGTWAHYGAEIWLCCPSGHCNTVIHRIDRHGTLSPSYQCSYPACTYHIQPMQLDKWDEK